MKTVIKNANVFDGEKIIGIHDVFLEDGIIRDEVKDSEVIDGTGCTLLPGLIDSHIHLNSIENLYEATKYGVTTMLDMATGSDELINSLRNQKGLTDIRSCHQTIVPEMGEFMLKAMDEETAEHMKKNYVSSVADVKTQVDRQIQKGADYIKVILAEPPLAKKAMSPEILREIVRYSHECGKMVHVHTTSVHTYELSIDAGVDTLHHLPQGELLPKPLIEKMKSKDLTAVPTLFMDKGMSEAAKRMMPERGADYSFVKKNFETLREVGVRIIAGTDSNYTNKMNFVPHGKSMHTELDLMVDGGMTPIEALVSATSLPAKTFNLEDRGVIASGYRGDLILVKGNPTENISDIRNIQKVWIAGERARI